MENLMFGIMIGIIITFILLGILMLCNKKNLLNYGFMATIFYLLFPSNKEDNRHTKWRLFLNIMYMFIILIFGYLLIVILNNTIN